MDGIPVLGSERLERYANGRLRSAFLSNTTRIGGLWCLRGTEVVLDRSGCPLMATLARTSRVGGWPCLKRRRLFLLPGGAFWNGVLAKEVRWKGIVLRRGRRATFDARGNLVEHAAAFRADRVVDGIPCRARTEVWFHASGSLAMAQLARRIRIGARSIPAGSRIVLDPGGRLCEVGDPAPRGVRLKNRVFAFSKVIVL